MNTSLDYAIKFAEKGWYVFPILPQSKFPYKGFEWRKLSLNNPEKIKAAAAHPKYVNCNWAIDCGKSDVFIIDLDEGKEKKGIETWRARFPGEAEMETFTVVTPSGGRHLYYIGRGRNSVEMLGSGVDTRGDGGYALIPGSTVNGTGVYSVLKDAPLIPIPGTIASFIKPPAIRKEKYDIPISEPDKEDNIKRATEWLKNEAPDAATGSGGDAATFNIACRLRDFNVSEPIALELLLEHWNDTKAFPPWDPTELEKKVANAFKYAKDFPGNDTPEAMFSGGAPFHGSIRCAADIDIKNIEPRKWLLGNRYLLGFTTLTIAPGGTGKSLLTILEGLAISSGKRLTHDEVKLQGAVWLYNTEDPFEELERRILATAKYYKLTREDMEKFYYDSAYENPLTLVSYDDRGRPLINQKQIDYIVAEIKRREIILFVLDPFVECHQVNENDNGAINMVMRAFRKIAKETGCAISVVHHTSKGKQDVHGNMDKARGASSLASAARIAHTFYTMNEKEAAQYGIVPASRRSWYSRLDSAKANLAPPSESFEWYEKKSVELFFDNEETTGILEPVNLDRVISEEGGEKGIMDAAMSLVEKQGMMTLKKVSEEIERAGIAGIKAKAIARKLEALFDVDVIKEDKEFFLGTEKVRGKDARNLSCRRGK